MARSQTITFTAAQAERISGVNGFAQRNLRRHGYMAAIEGGKARFALEDIAKLVAIGFLSERGIPPATSVTIANSCAAMIAAHALKQDHAIGDRDARKALIKKFAPRGLFRFAVVTGPGSIQVAFANDGRKIFYAASELGGAIVLDLKLYGLKIVDGAEQPLLTLLADEKDVA